MTVHSAKCFKACYSFSSQHNPVTPHVTDEETERWWGSLKDGVQKVAEPRLEHTSVTPKSIRSLSKLKCII